MKTPIRPHRYARTLALTLFAAVVFASPVATRAASVSGAVAGGDLAALLEQTDVGSVGVAGGASYAAGSFTVSGSGWDIWDWADGFHFAQVTANGDWQILARITGLENTDGWAKAGLMIRESLTAGSPHALLALRPEGGLVFQRRAVVDEGSGTIGETDVAVPVWVKLTRRGNVFTAQHSSDGANWELLGTETIAMAAEVHVGLAVCSHNDDTLTVATFDNVQVAPVPVPLVGTGDGLQATYFDLTSPVLTRVDPTLDFDWAAGAINPVMGVAVFSARWLGEIEAQFTENYTLCFATYDAVRVWLDDQLIINNWDVGAPGEAAATVPLVAGQRHLLKIEFYGTDSNALARLQWRSPSTPKTVLPQSQLYSEFTDNDHDGMPDLWEQAHGLNPNDPGDASTVPPGDGLTNLQKYLASIGSATVGNGVPDVWRQQDIGDVPWVGSAAYSNGLFTVAGSGNDIGNDADAFHYVYQPRSGNWQIVARIMSQQATDDWTRAGVMIRENLTPGSPHALMAVTPGAGRFLQHRSTADGASADSTQDVGSTLPDGVTYPVWVKLVRTGDIFTGYVSTNGVNWAWVHSARVELANAVLIGLAVTSHTTEALCTVTFDNVNVAAAATGPVVPGSGDGLAGSYFGNRYLRGEPVCRIDPLLDFGWASEAPMPAVARDNFSIAWLGEIEAQFTEPYTFHLTANDGVRLWVNEQLIINNWYNRPVGESTGTVHLTAGQRYLLRIEYYKCHSPAVASLYWSGPSTTLRRVPQSQLYSRFLDGDQDGLPDLWEMAYGLNPNNAADAAADADGDGLTNLQEFLARANPLVADTDGDGIADAWEVAYGLNPNDRRDATQDSDSDGLTNIEELLFGTDMFNADTDGDGLPDGMEVIEAGSNPTGSDISIIETLASVAGANATTNFGQWSVQGSSLVCTSLRGWVEYVLPAPVSGVFRLELQVRNLGAVLGNRPSYLEVSIDGEPVGRVCVPASVSTSLNVHAFTPWVQPGSHTVRLYWDNSVNAGRLAIEVLRLQALYGTDANANGVSDWVERRVRRQSSVEVPSLHMFSDQDPISTPDAPIAVLSAVSPLCLEGRSDSLSMMHFAIGLNNLQNGGSSWLDNLPQGWQTNPVVCLPAALQPQPGISNRWYLNVSLNVTQATALEVSHQNGVLTQYVRVAWVPLNLLSATNLALRLGDTLFMGVAPAQHTGLGHKTEISITGVTNYSMKVKDTLTHCFDQPGTYTVTGTYYPPGKAAPQSRTITVLVSAAQFNGEPACPIERGITWDCPALPPEAVIEHDARLTLEELPPPEVGRSFNLTALEPVGYRLIARLGTNGPIMAGALARGLEFLSSDKVLLTETGQLPDGSQLVEMITVLNYIPPGLLVEIEIIAGGILFDDGSVIKQLTAADFNAFGANTLRFIRPVTAQTSVCHITRVYQNGVLLGEF